MESIQLCLSNEIIKRNHKRIKRREEKDRGQAESRDWWPDNTRGPISARNACARNAELARHDITNMRREYRGNAHAVARFFLHHVSPRAPINRERRGMVLAYALKAPKAIT